MTQEERKQQILGFVKTSGLTMTAEFVPLSQYDPELWSKISKAGTIKSSDLTSAGLHWKVTLIGRAGSYSTTFHCGITHAPSYKRSGGYTTDELDNLLFELNTGHVRKGPSYMSMKGAPIPAPHVADVMYCLVNDADALDYSFEDWASNYGYDPDSRRAEKCYQACIECGLQLRRLIGDERLGMLREMLHDY